MKEGKAEKETNKKRKQKDNPRMVRKRQVREYIGKELTGEEKRWWDVLVTGALRTGERLNSAGIKNRKGNTIPKECELCCQNVTEDLEHIIWNCQNCEKKKIREKVLETLGKVAI